jgi:hypothetical protein
MRRSKRGNLKISAEYRNCLKGIRIEKLFEGPC